VSDEGISPELKRFIRQYIQSVEQLEILLLLRSQSSRPWTAKKVFDVIRSSERSAAMRLADFARDGFLLADPEDPDAYRYQPKTVELDRLVEATAAVYQSRRVLVIETIFTPDADPAQSFADAFRFKKE
jgi:hypothetical protein